MKGSRPSKTMYQLLTTFVPLIFSMAGLAAIYYDPDSRMFVVGIAVSAIFGFTLSNLVKHIENTKHLESINAELSEIRSHQSLQIKMSNSHRLKSANNLVEGLNEVEKISSSYPNISQFCDWKASQIDSDLQELARQAKSGIVVIDDPARELTSSLELLKSACNTEAIAVSFEDTPFWTSPEGEYFLREHEKAIERGVVITRIFIVDSEDESELLPIMDRQLELGVNVYKVRAKNVVDLNPSDVVIYDGRLVRRGYNKEYTSNNMFKSAEIVVSPETVNRERQTIEAILARSELHSLVAG